MSSNGTLILNQNYIQQGTGTLTFTVPATVSALSTPTANIPFVVRCQVTAPSQLSTGAGSGSGADQGLGMLGGTQGISTNNTTLGQGGTGLGFGAGTTQTTYNTSGSGYGAGDGGGDAAGFARGGLGTSDGGVGQGFGPDNSGYPQPIANINTPSTGNNAQTSTLSIVVNYNGTPVYTAPSFAVSQKALQFETPGILCNSTDVITVVLTSSTPSDLTLQAIKANISVVQGQN